MYPHKSNMLHIITNSRARAHTHTYCQLYLSSFFDTHTHTHTLSHKCTLSPLTHIRTPHTGVFMSIFWGRKWRRGDPRPRRRPTRSRPLPHFSSFIPRSIILKNIHQFNLLQHFHSWRWAYRQILVKNHFLEFIIIIWFIRKKIYQRTFAENLKGLEPLGRELCELSRGQVRRKIIKTLKEISTWTRHACVQEQKFCPSVADSLNGWQPVQTGSDEEYVHHNIMPEEVFEVANRPTAPWWKRLCSSVPWKGRRKARMRLSMPSWSGICGPNRDLLVLKWWSYRYQHVWLQPA